METNKICPNCRKPLPPDVPLGLCPECLIKSGFPTDTEAGVSGEAAGARFVPPPVEEIARLFPQLEILGLIGKGGMGAVYKARQPALDRFVALKVLPPAVGSDPGFAERFNREARALARLNHPNIVAVHDFGKAGPLHYLVMEFVDGANLREVEQAGRLSPEQALAIVPQICEALQFAHNEGIVHRDIKPENLLMDKKGRVKITDFGIAKIVGQAGGKAALTGAKDVVGTPHYMAPEQIEKPQTVDHRADIYSLGVVFYEMLTGELPLGKFAPPSRKVQMDVRLDEVVLHTLEKEPARRYQHVSQVKTDVETIAGILPPAAAGFAGRAGAVPPVFPLPADKTTSDKALLPAFLLALPFGMFGAHRFYVGKIGTAAVQLGAWVWCILLIIACATTGSHWQPTLGILLGFSLFGCVIWAVTDWILILCKAFTDGQGKRITTWFHPQSSELTAGRDPVTGPPASPSPATAPAAKAGALFPGPDGKSPVKPGAMIVAPAVALMVASMLKLSSALSAMVFFASPVTGWLEKLLEDAGVNPFHHWSVVPGFIIVFLKVVPACLILFGGFQMVQLRSYAWAIAASILAIVSCSLIEFPIGIWALVVLSLQEVRDTFANAAVSRPPKPVAKWPWILGIVAAAVVIVAGLIIAVVLALWPASGKPNLTVHGTVTDAVTGKPIAGARVDDNRYGADADKAPQQAWTDDHGRYELKTWYEEHNIAASAPGYETKMSILLTKAFGSEREKRMNFKLQPQGTTTVPAAGGVPLPPGYPAGSVPLPPAYQSRTDTNPPVSSSGTVPTPAAAPTTNAEMPAPPTTGTPAAQSEPYAHQETIIGKLVTKDAFRQDFNQTLPLTADGRLSLDNVNGRIEISGWDRNEVAIQALKHGKTSEGVEATEIEVNAHTDRIAIHTKQPSIWFGGKKDSANVDYAIRVPRGARLESISSVNGQIRIQGVAGDIQASTVNGETQIRGAAGDLKLSTVNGQIEAELAALGRGQTVSFSAVNGQIDATLPAHADAEVTATTVNGGISSEFPALVVKKQFPLGRNLKGTLGNGGARVHASTVNGGIRFRQGKDAK
jgi:hypothetical protein